MMREAPSPGGRETCLRAAASVDQPRQRGVLWCLALLADRPGRPVALYFARDALTDCTELCLLPPAQDTEVLRPFRLPCRPCERGFKLL